MSPRISTVCDFGLLTSAMHSQKFVVRAATAITAILILLFDSLLNEYIILHFYYKDVLGRWLFREFIKTILSLDLKRTWQHLIIQVQTMLK